MQCATRGAGAGSIQDKGLDGRIKTVAIGRHKEKAAVHGAAGGAQTAAAAVLKGLAGCEQGLLTHHAQSFDFFHLAFVVLDDPVTGDQLRGNRARVGHGDGVRKGKHTAQGITLFAHVLGLGINLDGIDRHFTMLTATIRS